ncbi:hypothetical protein [Frankia canadensis]|nr:hypothetical protein [Frankia canadensis]
MADVSVRFQVAGDSEIVLNLATAEAVRLVEAIMGKVAEAMGTRSYGNASPSGLGPGGPAVGGAAPAGGAPGNGSMGNGSMSNGVMGGAAMNGVSMNGTGTGAYNIGAIGTAQRAPIGAVWPEGPAGGPGYSSGR